MSSTAVTRRGYGVGHRQVGGAHADHQVALGAPVVFLRLCLSAAGGVWIGGKEHRGASTPRAGLGSARQGPRAGALACSKRTDDAAPRPQVKDSSRPMHAAMTSGTQRLAHGKMLARRKIR